MDPNNLQSLTTRLTQLRLGGVSTGKAPHKPILLLALMQVLEDNGAARPDHIPINAALADQFQSIWRLLLPDTAVGDFFMPVFYLPNEGFWKVWTQADAAPVKKYSSLTGAQAAGAWSCFAEPYQNLLAAPEVREIVRMVLLDTYFPQTKAYFYATYGQAELIAETDVLLQLEEPSPRYLRKLDFGLREGYVRHWKFRGNVLRLYDHTCCISGLRVENALLHPLVDACHIDPHVSSGIDHPGNGLALCKNLHAAFDAGLIALSNDYRVLVSSAFEESTTAYSLRQLAGQRIRLPQAERYLPAVEYLKAHRKRWGFV